MALYPGTVVGERYAIEGVVSRGGMGTICKARDANGQPVAIKAIQIADQHLAARFAREVHALAALRHPAIVRYLDSGITANNIPYLVMEWLEGEDLGCHMRHTAMALGDTLAWAAAVAEALAVVHGQGIVHRDIKPGNIFLVDGSPRMPKLIDFGIALATSAATRLTATGKLVGTPAYMAPEQARGIQHLDGRTDLFALGCVIYEGLAGVPPFFADSPAAVLARILQEPAMRLGQRGIQVPEALDELIARMLAKSPDERPDTAAEVAAELHRLQAMLGPEALAQPMVSHGYRPATLTPNEQRLVSLVVVSPGSSASESQDSPADRVDEEPTLPVATNAAELPPAERGVIFERLAGGAFAAIIEVRGTAIDQAASAAHLALRMRRDCPSRTMALVTGMIHREHGRLAGEAVSRAASMLEQLASGSQPGDSGGPDGLPGVLLDETTSGLLRGRFEMRVHGSVRLLAGRSSMLAVRPLLGRAVPFVGRTREMAILEATLSECIEERVARAVLMTGPAGVGKSRIAAELLRTVERYRGAAETCPEIWSGHGDPMHESSPLYIVAEAVRRAAGIRDGASLMERQSMLRAFVGCAAASTSSNTRARSSAGAGTSAGAGSNVRAGSAGKRLAAFLGELVEAPLGAHASVELSAARRDPALMSEQILRACEDLIRVITARRPLILLLEDLHWGDRGTVTLVDRLLRNLAEAPLFILAIGRPEVYERFPRLWSEREVTEVRVGPLKRRAAEELVRAVLAPQVGEVLDQARVQALVERADGNAFFLEELMRNAARGDWNWPASVLAVVEARLERLESRARQVLRAASVFGSVFWSGGVTALLGDSSITDEWLEHLVEQELVAEASVTRFPGQREYRFRHDLVREAAHRTLTHEDRKLGHQIAGEWLEHVGETDPRTLAEHFELGGSVERALPYFVRAAEDALERSALESAHMLADRGLACGAWGLLRGQLVRILADVEVWRGNVAEVARRYSEAMELLPRESAAWYHAAGEAGLALLKLGQQGHSERLVEMLRKAPPTPTPLPTESGEERSQASARVAHWLIALAKLAQGHITMGHRNLGDALTLALTELARDQRDPMVAAQVHIARACRAFEVHRDLAEALDELELAVQHLSEIGDYRQACTQRINLGYIKLSLGLSAQAERELRAALAAAERLGLGFAVSSARRELGIAVARSGAGGLAEAEALEDSAAAWLESYGDLLAAALCRIELAGMRMSRAALDEAERDARAAIGMLERGNLVSKGAMAFAVLSRVLSRAGRVEEACEAAAEARQLQAGPDATEPDEVLVSVAHAETLIAANQRERAAKLIGSARDRLLGYAQAISNPTWRESFLHGVPLHARVLELAQELGCAADEPVRAASR